MTTYVKYTPEDRELNLDHLTAADFDLIAGLRGQIYRGDATLICLVPGGNNGEMFIRKISDGVYRAVHFAGGAHGPHPVTPETPEHRRQKDYWARAAEDNGYTAALEVPVKGAGVMDVTITGGDVPTDIEIQHSEIKETEVKSRTTRYCRAGYLPVWFNDAGSDRPPWLRDVPALGCNRMPWDVLPTRRQVTATGLGVLHVVICEISVSEFNGRCPYTGHRPCGRQHPLVTAGRAGITVDDVAGMLPAGQLVPLRSRTATFLVSPEDLARYQDMTGGLGKWLPGLKPGSGERIYRQRPELCRNPVHNLDAERQVVPMLTMATAYEPTTRTRPRSAPGRPVCPGCGVSELTYGRELCQSCRVLGRRPL